MLTLYLLRHAKSSWAKPFASDFERALNERGRADAPRMGRFITRLEDKPAIILCSPARRARETLDLVLPQLDGHGIDIQMPADLYPGDARAYLELIQRHGGDAPCLLLIGHNPALEDLAALLTADGDADARAALARKYPTAALAVLTFDATDWSKIAAGGGRLASFTAPAMLKTGA